MFIKTDRFSIVDRMNNAEHITITGKHTQT